MTFMSECMRRRSCFSFCTHSQGRSQKSGNGGGGGGAKILDRKPHLLINAETGSDYYTGTDPGGGWGGCNPLFFRRSQGTSTENERSHALSYVPTILEIPVIYWK